MCRSLNPHDDENQTYHGEKDHAHETMINPLTLIWKMDVILKVYGDAVRDQDQHRDLLR